MKSKILIGVGVLCLLGLGAFLFVKLNPRQEMQDGFYMAEMAEASHGWREYLYIMVKNDKIVYAEYNAKDDSGYVKAWDNAYMRNMLTKVGTYPNEYTRGYVAQLIKTQDPQKVDAISGASESGKNFDKLSKAVIEQAKKGVHATAFVSK